MAMFDETSQTIGLEAAAKRLGIGRTLAYEQAHRPDKDGRLWLCDDVRILKIGGRYRVPKNQIDAAIGEESEQVAS